MGGGAFILLKTGRRGPGSAKQAEIRLASLLKILRIASFPSPLAMMGRDSLRLYLRQFPLDMPNSRGIARSVIQITVFVRKLAQNAAAGCKSKII